MNANVLDYYPWIADEDKERFRQACIAGTDPLKTCPLCSGTRIRSEARWRFCPEHKAWELNGHVLVACYRCRIRYGVFTGRIENHEKDPS